MTFATGILMDAKFRSCATEGTNGHTKPCESGTVPFGSGLEAGSVSEPEVGCTKGVTGESRRSPIWANPSEPLRNAWLGRPTQVMPAIPNVYFGAFGTAPLKSWKGRQRPVAHPRIGVRCSTSALGGRSEGADIRSWLSPTDAVLNGFELGIVAAQCDSVSQRRERPRLRTRARAYLGSCSLA